MAPEELKVRGQVLITVRAAKPVKHLGLQEISSLVILPTTQQSQVTDEDPEAREVS